MKWLSLILIIIISLFSLNFVSALDVPSQVRTTKGVCEVLTPDFTTLKQNTDFTFYFHVYNDTSFIDNTDANCTFHLYSVSDNGLHILQVTGEVPFLPIRDFYAFVNGTTNLSDIGRYSYLFECGVPKSFLKGAQSDVCGIEGEFEVTSNGSPSPEGIVLILFVLLFLILLGCSVFITIYIIGHFARLDVDLIDVSFSWGLYFVMIGVYYLQNYYVGNIFMNDILSLFLSIGGLMLVFLPALAFILSLMLGNLNKKKWQMDFNVPQKIRFGRRR